MYSFTNCTRHATILSTMTDETSTTISEQPGSCPTGALRLLGDYVTLRIVDTLREKELRFQELRRSMEEVNQVTLSRRLKIMEKVGVLTRQVETIDRQSVTYRLTAMGLGLLPLLEDIKGFTQRFGVPDSFSGT